jgi:hypothetical protein
VDGSQAQSGSCVASAGLGDHGVSGEVGKVLPYQGSLLSRGDDIESLLANRRKASSCTRQERLLTSSQSEELFGTCAPRSRPQTGATAASENYTVTHGRMVLSRSPENKSGAPWDKGISLGTKKSGGKHQKSAPPLYQGGARPRCPQAA